MLEKIVKFIFYIKMLQKMVVRDYQNKIRLTHYSF